MTPFNYLCYQREKSKKNRDLTVVVKTSVFKEGSQKDYAMFSKENLFITFILVLLLSVLNGAPVTWDTNSHVYTVVQLTTPGSAYADAVTQCASPAYVATVSNVDEWKFIVEHVLAVEDPAITTQVFIAGSMNITSGILSYDQGPESKLDNPTIFTHVNGQCFGFCNFDPITAQPQLTAENVVIDSTSSNTWKMQSTADYVLCESGGYDGTTVTAPVTESYIAEGGQTLTLVTPDGQEPVVSTTITFTNIQNPTDTFQIVYPTPIPAGSGSYIGSYDIPGPPIITVNFMFTYQQPYVSSYYPISSTNTLFTIVGQNFGEDNSAIAVTVGGQACATIEFLVSQQAISCSLATLPTSYSPIQVTVNGIPSTTSRLSVYYVNQNQFLLNSYQAELSTNYSTQKLGLQTAYPVPCITSTEQAALLKSNNINTQPNELLISLGVAWDPEKSAFVVDDVTYECIGYDMENPDPTWTSTTEFYYDVNANKTLAITDPLAIYSTLLLFGGVPTLDPSQWPSASTAGGDNVPITVSNTGFLLSTVTIGDQGPFPRNDNQSYTYTTKAGYLPYTAPVSINGQATNKNFIVSYAAPTMTSVSNPPTDGSEAVIITGTNFFTDASLITVTIGGIPCTSPVMVASNTQVSCTYIAGSGTVTPVVLKLGQVLSNELPMEYASPVISDIKSACTSDFDNVEITGSNFGTVTADVTVTIDTAPCTINSVTQTTITCSVPAGNKGDITNKVVTVTVKGLVSETFTIYCLDFAPMSFGNTNTPLEIIGSGFEAAGLTVTIGTADCVIIDASVTANGFKCTPDTWPQTLTSAVTITWTDLANPITKTFTYTQLDSISFDQNDDGTQVTIDGNGLGDFATTPVQIKAGSVSITACTQASIDGPLVCTIPASVVSATYTVENVISSTTFDWYLSPVLTALTFNGNALTTLPTDGGNVEFSGKFFETTSIGIANNITITIGTYTIDISESNVTSSELIEVHVPSGVGKNLAVNINLLQTAHDRSSPQTVTLSYTAPKITDVSNSNNVLTVFGTNFGDFEDQVTVTGYTTSKITIDHYSDAAEYHLYVTIPNDSTLDPVDFSITVAGQASDDVLDFVLTPQLVSITPLPTTSGATVKVNGYFMKDSYAVTMKLSNGTSTTLTCTNGNTDNTAMDCKIPSGQGKFTLTITNEHTKTFEYETQYQSPTLTGATITYNQQTKKILVTITGQNFGITPPVVKLNETTCQEVQLIEGSTLTCNIPDITFPPSGNTVVFVQSAELQSSNQYDLQYPTSCGSCSGQGVCSTDGSCACNLGFYGEQCDNTGEKKKESNGWKIALGILLPLFVIAALVALVAYLRHRRRASYNRYSKKYFMEFGNENH
ncbi:hypothetical protein DLAC_01965 [Tieghemostelium lacteum]|uniref:EGF-like domain-containing protein n=1 Tax=Tieghemostelium lacteum TaxID=361077 RepID=A0A152A5M2_TIELA|nr:hypothetical protein DLAC_01965 [Tieghemostelium lacteum]|eukprot:KYR01377.1 hypothetical protein DLAC_01965 [Tieghemostelium lacteum]